MVQFFAASSNRQIRYRCPTTPTSKLVGLGCFPFAHHYLGNRNFFLFLQLLRCFSSLGWLFPVYIFNRQYLGLPHSDISGSLQASSSPERFVGNYVLLRLCVPRYPPLALISLTTLNIGVYLRLMHSTTSFVLMYSAIKFAFDKLLCNFQGSVWTLAQQSCFGEQDC